MPFAFATSGRSTTSPPGPEVGALSFPGGISDADSGALTISRAVGASSNVGDDEFTIEMWIRPSATPGDNPASGVTEGANPSGTDGNIIGDSWNSVATGAGFIIGLDAGVFYFSARDLGSGNSRTEIGTTDLRDGQWHHVAAYRDATSGLIELFVDGDREGSVTGFTGTVAYEGGGSGTDLLHVLGKEKQEAGGQGFDGEISEVRISTNRRYNGVTYTVPTAPFTTDANTVCLLHLGDNTGTTAADSSGGGNNGTLIGSPAPSWLTADPFGGS